MMRGARVVVLMVFAGCASAPPSTAPRDDASGDADTARILGPASMLTPPPEEASTPPAPKDATPADTGVAALPSAQPAPVAAPPPPLDLTEGPLPEVLAEGASLLRSKSWVKARSALTPAVAKVDAVGVPDDVLVAHTLLGRAHFGLHEFKSAKKEYDAASAATDAARSLVASDGDEGRRHVREARLALAAAEALFATAEEARRAAEQRRPPVLRGARDSAGVTTFVRKDFGPWLSERRKLVEDAERAYLKILEVKPFPPPIWTIAASRADGGMWDELVTETSSVPTPREWEGEGTIGQTPKAELRSLYRDALDQSLAPLRERVRGAYRVCSEQAKRFALHNDDAAACDDWLAKHPSPKP